jgi:hypothetical protein
MVVVVVVVVILTLEDGYTAPSDHDYDHDGDGDGGGKIIFGYLSSYQVPLLCLEWFWCCEISCFRSCEGEVFAQSKDLVVVFFFLPHKLTWLPYWCYYWVLKKYQAGDFPVGWMFVLYIGNSSFHTSFIHYSNYKLCWNATKIYILTKHACRDLSSQFAQLRWERTTHQYAFVTLSWRILVE